MAAHKPVRSWRSLWLRPWCSCGERRRPCPEELAERVAPSRYWQEPRTWRTWNDRAHQPGDGPGNRAAYRPKYVGRTPASDEEEGNTP